MKYTFKSGAVVEGTIDQILAIAKSLGETVDLSKLGEVPRGYYNSSHSGLTKISEMNVGHVRNALLKVSKDYFEDMRKSTRLSNADFLKKYVALASLPVVEDLFNELGKR
jgi:hypothetical protein